jgi:hypothetical protein
MDSRLRGNDNIVGFMQLCKALQSMMFLKKRAVGWKNYPQNKLEG